MSANDRKRCAAWLGSPWHPSHEWHRHLWSQQAQIAHLRLFDRPRHYHQRLTTSDHGQEAHQRPGLGVAKSRCAKPRRAGSPRSPRTLKAPRLEGRPDRRGLVVRHRDRVGRPCCELLRSGVPLEMLRYWEVGVTYSSERSAGS